jgi:ribosomal protein S18 acetylase RimI-like enzyme
MERVADKLLIRKIELEDADQISEIQSAITNTAAGIDFRQIIEQQLQRDEDIGYVAEIDGRVVGFIISSFVYGGFGLEKSAWITNFGVHPDCMAEGIGKSLANELFKVYKQKGIKNIFSSVPWDSVDILSFFKTLGFDRSSLINLRKDL